MEDDLNSETIAWTYQDRRFSVPIQRKGLGSTVLMLPALSSISTIDELSPLSERLADHFATVSLDWPGFGTVDKPRAPWNRAALAAFLDHALDEVCPHPFAVVAAGHAAGYLLDAARQRPGVAGRLVLVAPTWRGPLPTMLGRRTALGAGLVRWGDLPILGQALYRLNVNRPMVRLMGREHVYESATWLDPARLAGKMAVTRSSGARHAALRFVTGELDLVDDRDSFIRIAATVRDPILVIYGANSPRKSKAEMEALTALPNVTSGLLPHGKLAVHEEYPDAVFDAMMPFLDEHRG